MDRKLSFCNLQFLPIGLLVMPFWKSHLPAAEEPDAPSHWWGRLSQLAQRVLQRFPTTRPLGSNEAPDSNQCDHPSKLAPTPSDEAPGPWRSHNPPSSDEAPESSKVNHRDHPSKLAQLTPPLSDEVPDSWSYSLPPSEEAPGPWKLQNPSPSAEAPYASRVLGHDKSNKKKSQFAVKVENLSKVTEKEDLEGILMKFRINSVEVIDSDRGNHACIKCIDLATAHEVKEALNGRHLLGNTLTVRANIKDSHTSKELFTVKVLIYSQLTGVDLDDYFKGYGKMCGQTSVRKGCPDYAFMSFYDPFCAQDACNDSPHTIKGVNAVAVPINKIVSCWLNLKFSCNPVASRRIRQELLQYEDIMKIDAKKGMLDIQVDIFITNFAKKKVKRTIRKHESCLARKKLKFEFYYLPVLADPGTVKRLASTKLPSCIEVSWGSVTVPLKVLKDDYRRRGVLGIQPLKYYISRSVQYHWYWFDDYTFQPYPTKINKYIERNFKDKEILEVDIGSFSYTIDTNQMTQTNIGTSSKRQIKRIQVDFSEDSTISLHITAFRADIDELCNKIINILNKESMTKTRLTVPNTAMPFKLILLETARKNFVEAVLSEEEIAHKAAICLRGKKHHVEVAKEDLLKNMVGLFPLYWDSQVNNCELKEVFQQSLEEVPILDILNQQGFECDIYKIERIQNLWLWEAFGVQMNLMYAKNDGKLNERFLFHGTRKVSPKAIYASKQGFDPRCSRQGCLLGEGTYFADRLEYSHNYAHQLPNGKFQMFLARVITGISCTYKREDRSLKAPPLKERYGDGSSKVSKRYDSTTTVTKDSRIYAVYELYRAYPEYLITYIV